MIKGLSEGCLNQQKLFYYLILEYIVHYTLNNNLMKTVATNNAACQISNGRKSVNSGTVGITARSRQGQKVARKK